MRISMIGPVYPYRGGISHYTSSLASALDKSGHQVQIISFKRQYPSFLYPGESDKDPSLNALRVDAKYLLDPLYPWTWQQTKQAIIAFNSDLLLIHWWTTFWGPSYAALTSQIRRRVPVVYLIHNVLPHEARPWDKWLARLALKLADNFIVQAPHEKDRLTELIPNRKIHYCSHPTYQRFSESEIPQKIAKQQLCLPLDRPVFLFFGIVRPYKGLKVLLEALAHSNALIHLVIAGEFWENVTIYQNLIKELELSQRVTLFNRYVSNEDAHVLFSAADGLIAPYVGGTQSGVVELALGYGLPAIVTDRIAAGIEQANITGIKIVPTGNVSALAVALTQLTEDLPSRHDTQPAADDWGRMVNTIEQIHANMERSVE